MRTFLQIPEVTADAAIARALLEACGSPEVLPDLEVQARETGDVAGFAKGQPWEAFTEAVLEMWRSHDHVIIRGLPALAEGASLLLASLALRSRFKTYRAGKIVKTFRMSPWTTDLSHTLKEGHFHTDLNTEAEPPAVTCIQCLAPDPGAPEYGVNRVARVADLLSHLKAEGNGELLRFLCETRVTMVNARSDSSWAGTVVEGERIRFHPETLRAAAQRFQEEDPAMERLLSELHNVALAVSVPFWLDAGDILFVSNHRALHYRGECSVVFHEYPLQFSSRAIHVLHKLDEPR